MKKWMTIIALVLTSNVVVGFLVNNFSMNTMESEKVVNLAELYSNFEMTKHLNVKYETLGKVRLEQIDSLSAILIHKKIALSKASTKEKYNEEIAAVNTLNEQKTMLEQIDMKMRTDYENQIWNQLNTYMLDFGKTNNYPVIIGSKNDGNVLFVKDDMDITNELLQYVNNRYLGKLEQK